MTNSTFAFEVKTPGAKYTPWTNGYAVGYQVEHKDGRKECVYLNPSCEEPGDDPNVFIYWGATGDPASDSVLSQHVSLELDDTVLRNNRG